MSNLYSTPEKDRSLHGSYFNNENSLVFDIDAMNSINNSREKNTRTIYDPIHGHISLDGIEWDIINTLHFQRLRNLKQLGNCHYVYLGATHSRFEHSIGVSYLSNRLYKQLLKNDSEINSNEYERYLTPITIAGLCHDLGHGPFSHLFDRKVIKTLEYNSFFIIFLFF